MSLKKLLTITTLTFALSACSSSSHDHNSHAQNYYTGPIEPQQLLSEYPVFSQHKNDNQQPASDQEVAQLAKQLHKKDIKIFLGTWCHDSQREVPRLLNLIEKVKRNHPEVQFTITFDAVAPTENRNPLFAEQYNLTYVPTIILFDNNREMGRIIERPAKSLALDMIAMK